MAVDTMARPVRRPYAIPVYVRPVWLLVALLVAVGLVWGNLALSAQVAAASERVQRLEAQVRAEQARGDQLRVGIAELQSLERIVPAGTGRLNMRAPSPATLAFVATPRLVATGSGAVPTATPWAGGSGGSTVARGWQGPESRPTLAAAQPVANSGSERTLWDRLAAILSPKSAAASEVERGER